LIKYKDGLAGERTAGVVMVIGIKKRDR
jgi:hypothetical protein